jgi:hypothetical protein
VLVPAYVVGLAGFVALLAPATPPAWFRSPFTALL